MTRKKCTKCGVIKNETEFHWKSIKHKRRLAHCKKCNLIAEQQRRKRNPQKQIVDTRRANLKSNFGMTIEQYEAMLTAQNNLCAICGNLETHCIKGQLLRLAVDHDHATDTNRALLCGKCNLAAGNVNDSSERAKQLLAYLEKWKC